MNELSIAREPCHDQFPIEANNKIKLTQEASSEVRLGYATFSCVAVT